MTVYPSRDPWDYPVHCGPGALYPAEPSVRPVWEGCGPEYVRLIKPAPDTLNSQAIITTKDTWPAWEECWYSGGPRSLAKLARGSGWEARMGFSRGYVPGLAKDSWEIRDMIGVYLNGYGRRAAAFWERNPDAEFSQKKLDSGTIKPGEIPSGMAWSSSGTWIGLGNGMVWTYANLTDLKEWVLVNGAVLPLWYTMIQAWVQAHTERDVRAAREKPAKAAERGHA